jgi:hypothetical protein
MLIVDKPDEHLIISFPGNKHCFLFYFQWHSKKEMYFNYIPFYFLPSLSLMNCERGLEIVFDLFNFSFNFDWLKDK